ncbi:MAG: carboxypeptidase regulatory-like domain-containing protein [Planctomycetes bacterium]|nr:carboxypeptidase regulatory-like domain-containing protein [Planctomycetota bacterium]MBI3844104.1 carboxypeptidase regulatory-like domain-containing protein [Planctomycetota bacterium]
MARISTASWIALAAAAAVAFVVLILGHGGGRQGDAEVIPQKSERVTESPLPHPAPDQAIEGIVKGIAATKSPGHVTAWPVWPPDAFARAVSADIQPDGSFRVGPLERAIHVVEVDVDSAAPILVEEAHPGDRIEVTATSGVTIAGSVRTVDGVPIPRASVWALYPRPYIGRRLAVCDAEGHFRVSDLPPGIVHLFAEAERFAPALAEVDVTEEIPTAGDSIRRDLFLGRGTDLVGLVRSRDTGEPLPDATVLAWKFSPAVDGLCSSNESLLLQRARTGADGFFRLPKLPSTRVRGWVSARGQAPASFDVPLAGDWRIERADVDLPIAGRASVRIVGENGEPQVDVGIEAISNAAADSTSSTLEAPLPREMRLSRRRRSDASGQSTFEDLRGDRYVYFELTDSPDRLPRYSTESFWPVPGKLVTAPEFRVRKGGRALARILLPDDEGAAFARVRYAGRGFLADATGVVRVEGIDGPSGVAEIDHPLAAPTMVAMAMATAKEVSGLRWVLDPGYEITGRIVDDGGGDAIGAATVVVTGSSPFSWTRRARSDADGTFRLIGLGPLPWVVETNARGHVVGRTDVQTAPAAPLTLSLERRAP